MSKLYLNEPPKNNLEVPHPKKETIAFLLSYSKALVVNDYETFQFETVLN
ncbi:hypothetical protein GCM10009117_02240 [Gangjinia marincola]|uniref:Uncharacterized protein n=1 Tax=Gangjinia marincola TaxID=578463 RepID=A0ABP3XRX1_9FLAO